MNTINTKTLYPYQEEGVEFLLRNKGGILLDEQGCGKTIQAITAVDRALTAEEIKKVLIICPSIMRRTWKSECEKWCTVLTSSYSSSSSKIQVIETSKQFISDTATICICSYEYALHNFKTYRNSASGFKYKGFDCVIVDESHKIKNPSALRTKAVLNLLVSPTIKYKILLTGTPITKCIDDLYCQLRPFLPEEVLGKNIYSFRRNWMYQKSNGFGMEYYGCKDSAKLHDLLYSVALRRTKKEVLPQLPKLMHNKIVVDIKKSLADESMKFVDLAIQSVLGKPVKLDTEESLHVSQVRKTLGLSKVKATVKYVMNLLEDSTTEDNEKIVVFAYHTDVITALKESFTHAKIECGVITGSTSMSTRQTLINRFQDKKDTLQVLVVNILAGGVGITLTAASTEVFAELDWTPANIQQAEARCHRISQTRDVNVTFMLGENSLDTAIFDTLIEKLKITKEIL